LLNKIASFATTSLVQGEFVSTTQNFPGGNTLTIKNSIITANGESPHERSFRTTLFIFYMLKLIQYLNNFYYFHDMADAYQIKNQT